MLLHIYWMCKLLLSLLESELFLFHQQINKFAWTLVDIKFCWWADSTVPPCLSSKERIHLVDAGLLINVGYPPFLGDKRDIDLIIAPEYSAGNIFEVRYTVCLCVCVSLCLRVSIWTLETCLKKLAPFQDCVNGEQNIWVSPKAIELTFYLKK